MKVDRSGRFLHISFFDIALNTSGMVERTFSAFAAQPPHFNPLTSNITSLYTLPRQKGNTEKFLSIGQRFYKNELCNGKTTNTLRIKKRTILIRVHCYRATIATKGERPY